jgi:hypothetical protein
MKKEIKRILKERGKTHLYSEHRWEIIKEFVKLGMKKDPWLNNYLKLDPLNKAQFAADNLIMFAEMGKI